MNNRFQQKEGIVGIMFSSLIALLVIVASIEPFQNVVLAAVKTNSTNMMITDTDTKMMMNGFSGMSLNNKTGTMTMNNAHNGMMLMINNKSGVMVMMNPANDTINKKTCILIKTDPRTGITMIMDKETGMILDPQTDKMLSSEAGKIVMQNESGMMMRNGMDMKNTMK